MGVYVTVRLFRNRVPESTWKRIYADSLVLFRNWPDPPMGVGHRDVAGVRVITYTRDIERENGWLVVGDANSKLGAESFELPKNLQAWRSTFVREATVSSTEDQAKDAIQILAEEDADYREKPTRLACLLGNKTQGLPYHSLIIAVAILIENRLPGVALAMGDFGIPDTDRPCRELSRIFAERFERPILLEPARIHERVPEVDAAMLSERHTRRIEPKAAAMLERLYAMQRTEMQDKALVCTDANQLSDRARMALTVMGIRLAELTSQLSPIPKGEDVARTRLRAIAEGTKSQNMTLTDTAWDCIESAHDETSEFLYHACQFDCECLATHQVFRAVYENPSVRDYVVAQWRNELRSPKGIPRELLNFMSSSEHGRG